MAFGSSKLRFLTLFAPLGWGGTQLFNLHDDKAQFFQSRIWLRATMDVAMAVTNVFGHSVLDLDFKTEFRKGAAEFSSPI